MKSLEIPLGKRTKFYRFFEILPAVLSYGMIILLIVLAFFSPLLAAVYLLLVIITMLVKAVGIAAHTITGRKWLNRAQNINWHERLSQLENPAEHLGHDAHSSGFAYAVHLKNLQKIANSDTPDQFPKPSMLYNAVIIAVYNESYEVVAPTLQSIVDTTYDNKRLIIVIAYEERAGKQTEEVVQRLKKEFGHYFKEFILVGHPDGLPNEVRGKGGNITFAGQFLASWIKDKDIRAKDVLVTTLDSDNRPHATYFDYVTYEYIVHPNRKKLAFQPIALFLNNIWDVPAPMRVIATGNSFWNIISSMRPHVLRNFASHSQPMEALVEMDFWSKRTIVEDGHQYWRSYFHFKGDYHVVPIYVPIYQDAVLSEGYVKTLKAQFTQLRRWAYGASDIPYVAERIFTTKRTAPFWPSFARFFRLLDGHVTLASASVLFAIGGWVPLIINSDAARNIAAHQLPEVTSILGQVGMVGMMITAFLGFKMLPPRPARYKRRRSLWMILQWGLMPITAIVYSAASAFNAQTHLLLGRYLDKFDVTEKATHQSVARAREAKGGRGGVSKQ